MFSHGEMAFSHLNFPSQIANVVINGERPEIKSGWPLPDKIIDLMTSCWDQHPRKRPDFNSIQLVLFDVLVSLNIPISSDDFTPLSDDVDDDDDDDDDGNGFMHDVDDQSDDNENRIKEEVGEGSHENPLSLLDLENLLALNQEEISKHKVKSKELKLAINELQESLEQEKKALKNLNALEENLNNQYSFATANSYKKRRSTLVVAVQPPTS